MKSIPFILLFAILFSCSITTKKRTAEPLYVVNGVVCESIDTLKPKQIEEIHVLKGEAAIKAYGRKGKHGVIQIKTK